MSRYTYIFRVQGFILKIQLAHYLSEPSVAFGNSARVDRYLDAAHNVSDGYDVTQASPETMLQRLLVYASFVLALHGYATCSSFKASTLVTYVLPHCLS